MIETKAQLRIPKRRNYMAPQKLRLRFLQLTARHFAFGLDHGAVVGTAVPGLALIGRPFLAACPDVLQPVKIDGARSEEHTSELQSLMRISYAVFCLKKKIRHSHLHY